MSYIANKNTTASCIYGTWYFKEGEPVPLLMAVKFPQHVTEIKDPIVVETPKVEEEEEIKEEKIEIETKNEKRKGQTL